jgi:SAM-dependent methyltransferase
MMFNDLRCVSCNHGGLVPDGNNGYACPACAEPYPLVQGIPFLGYYGRDDFAGLMELVKMSEQASHGNPVPDFAMLDSACETFHKTRDEKNVREMYKTEEGLPWWFPYRYSEWKIWRRLLQDMDLTGLRILNVGAGEGYCSWSIQKRGGIITAIECSTHYAALGKRNLPDIRWLGGFSHALPFKDNSFDVVTCNAALHHMRDVPASISEFLRVLRPGGALMTAGDPFSRSDAADRHLLKLYDEQKYTLLGINENAYRADDYMQTLIHYSPYLEADIFATAGGVPDEFGLPLNYLRRWGLNEFLSGCSKYSGVFASRVVKRGTPHIPAKVLADKWFPASEFDALCQSGGGAAGLVPQYSPPDCYFNIPVPQLNHDKFLQLNGWRIPVPDLPYQEGYGRVNSYWRRSEGETCLFFELEAPVYGSCPDVLARIYVNGSFCSEQSMIRGLRYGVSLDITGQAEGKGFLVTVQMPDSDDFEACIIRIYQQAVTSADAGANTWRILGESGVAGLHGLLGYRFKSSEMLHVLFLPGTYGLAEAFNAINSSPIPVHYYFPECMEAAAEIYIPDGQAVTAYKYSLDGIYDCIGKLPHESDALVLVPLERALWPELVYNLQENRGITVLPCKESEKSENKIVQRVRSLIDSAGGGSKIYLYGAGEHTEFLLKNLGGFYVKKIEGLLTQNENPNGPDAKRLPLPLLNIEDINDTDIIIISSNIYQDVIYGRIKHLERRGVKIVKLYP